MNKITDVAFDHNEIRIYRKLHISPYHNYPRNDKRYKQLLNILSKTGFDWQMIERVEYWYHPERITTL